MRWDSHFPLVRCSTDPPFRMSWSPDRPVLHVTYNTDESPSPTPLFRVTDRQSFSVHSIFEKLDYILDYFFHDYDNDTLNTFSVYTYMYVPKKAVLPMCMTHKCAPFQKKKIYFFAFCYLD